MSKKLRAPLILLAILLALGGLAKWDEWKTTKETAASKTKGKIVELKPEDVTAVDYATTGTDVVPANAAPEAPPGAPPAAVPDQKKPEPAVVSLAKAGDAWRTTKPMDAPADAGAVLGLIKAVTDYSSTSVVSETKDKWAEFGLVTPQRTVTLGYTEAGKPQTFTVFVGNKAPIGYNVYFRTSTGGDKVYLGGQHLLLSTAKTLNDFRDKTVVKIDEKTIKSIVYASRSQPAIALEKGADGHYAIVRPEPMEADDNEVRDFVDGLNQLRAESFVDAPRTDETLVFNNPDYSITWTTDKGEATTLRVLDKGNKLGAALDPRQRLLLLADDQRVKVRKELINFRNRRVLRIDSVELTRVDVDGDKYVNVGGSWYKPEDAAKLDDQGALKAGEKDKPAEQAHVRAFVVDLEFARADQFLPSTDPAAKSLAAPPEHRITLGFKDPKKMPEIVLDTFPVPGQSEKLFVKRSGSDTLYRVNKAAFNSMKPGHAPVPGDPPPPDAGMLNAAPPSDEDLGPDDPAPDLSKTERPRRPAAQPRRVRPR